MSRFYSNKSQIFDNVTTADVLRNDISAVPVTKTSEYKEHLIEQQSNIPLLTQYDDFILNNIQNLINKYNYVKFQWSSEYYKDKAMLIAEFNQVKDSFHNNFKTGNEYEYENSVVPALFYSTIGYHASKIAFKNHFFMRNIIGVAAFAKIFEFNAPETYGKVKTYLNQNIDFGKKETADMKNKVASLKTGLKNTFNDYNMTKDLVLQESIHDLRIKTNEILGQKD
ncbi:hypothetical protein QEN19_000788 [Hanseniaspora menglaensis]